MSLFEGKYLSDEDIWERVERLESRRRQIAQLLAQPEISTDPERLPALSREFSVLGEIQQLADDVRQHIADLRELEELMEEADAGDDAEELLAFREEYRARARAAARRLYQWLLRHGCIDEEKEDPVDLRILRYIRRMGPEYAWRLGVNLGIDEVQARERLARLQVKGLLERVQGTMLDNYHRQRGWTKHMNHTYYQLSREGELYLRQLERGQGS